jgi:hypothetical protein
MSEQVIADTNVSAGALAIDGKKMVLVSRDGIINLWDLHQQVTKIQTPIRAVQKCVDRQILRLVFSWERGAFG